MLESDKETEDANAKIQQLQNKIVEHNRKYPMALFHTENTPGNEWKRVSSDDDDDDDGGAGGICTTDCADLRAHGYKVKPRVGDIVDEKGGVLKAHSKSKVWKPLSTYAPR